MDAWMEALLGTQMIRRGPDWMVMAYGPLKAHVLGLLLLPAG